MKVQSISKRAVAVAAVSAAVLAGGACTGTVSVPIAGRVSVATSPSSGAAASKPAGQPLVDTSSPAAGGGGAASLQAQFVQVVKKVSPSVVQVETPAGLGSGVVYDGAGDIVTNAHVVGSYTAFTVTTSSGARERAALVAVDVADDLAVIRTSATGLVPATFGDSTRLEVGDVVMALGSPFGLQGSVTQGLVSALDRQVAESRRVTLNHLVQTSAPINPGNSGGALVDLNGDVVGIPTLGATGGDGIGFAISGATVLRVVPALIGSRA